MHFPSLTFQNHVECVAVLVTSVAAEESCSLLFNDFHLKKSPNILHCETV